MDNNIKSNTSFWSEISEYKIQVPFYQRDYAQGRKDGGKIDNIREVFIEELYGALKGQNVCHLGLVFGSYNENEKVFIAVDGQQRLTTIFLLHWYVAWHENKLNEYREDLLNFSWDTRSYSSQFVELLFKIQPSNNVINAIKTNSNYFSVWENDPTVNGMLTMLEEIESKYPQNECNLCNGLFADNCKIQYDILKLEKGSDGKTYLKMNSRGRSLTTFELFKSKFLDKYHPIYEKKFDNEWLNFMLKKFADNDSQFSDPDIPFMNFINEYTYLQLKSNCGSNNSNEYKEFIDAKLKGDLIDIPFISFNKYNCAFEGKCLVLFEKSLDWIQHNYDIIKQIDYEVRFCDSKFFIDEIIKYSNPNFLHRAKLFAALKYAELTKYADLDPELYKKWTRVFRNLVANSDIDGSDFASICKAINKINVSNIYSYLSNGGELTAFSQEQVKEEVVKATKIIDNPLWEKYINKAEICRCLKGKIWVLFQNGENTDLEQFNQRRDLLYTILDNQDEYFLPKILLSYYDKEKPKKTIELKKDEKAWKVLLTDKKTGLFNCFQRIESNTINTDIKYQWIKDVSTTQLLNNSRKDAKIIGSDGSSIVLWGTSGCRRTVFGNEVWGNVVIGNYRTLLLDLNIELQNKKIIVENTNFVSCFDVNFKYNSHFFQWWGTPNEKELDVYLMENDWKDYKKRPKPTTDKGTDEDKYYCFRVETDNPDIFLKRLDELIEKEEKDS